MGTATDGRVIRKYRLPTAQLVSITLILGLPGIPLARSIVPEDDAPVTFRAGMLVLMSVVYLFIVWFWRAATVVHQDHITVRQLFRTRRTAWSDVLLIETEPASTRTMLFDRKGRRFALPGGVAAQVLQVAGFVPVVVFVAVYHVAVRLLRRRHRS